MRKWMRIGFVTVLVLPFCLTLSSLNSYITNPLGISLGVPVLLANGEDMKKEEPQKAVIEEKPEEVSKEPEIKKGLPRNHCLKGATWRYPCIERIAEDREALHSGEEI